MIEGRQFRAEIDADDLRRAANEGRHGPLTRAGIPEVLRFITEGLLRRDENDRLALDDVLLPLETPEFPAQRIALCDLLKRRFGGSVARSGQTLVEFHMPVHLDQTIAAARVVKEAGPPGRDKWGDEALRTAGPPLLMTASATRLVPRAVALDDVDENVSRPADHGDIVTRTAKQEPSHGRGHGVLSQRSVQTQGLPRLHARVLSERVQWTERVPPPDKGARGNTEPVLVQAAMALLTPDVTEVFEVAPSRPRNLATSGQVWLDVDVDHEDWSSPPRPPIASPVEPLAASRLKRPAKRWAPRAMIVGLWILAMGTLWAVLPWGLDRGAKVEPTSSPELAANEETEMVIPVGATEVTSTPVTAPIPAAPEVAAISTERAVPVDEAAETLEPEAEPAPDANSASSIDLGPPAEPVAPPRTAPASKPKRKKPEPRLPLPPSQITVALMVGAPMDIDIDGVQRGLTMTRLSSKLTVTPGRVWVRWRRPGGEWKRRRVVIEPGVDYKVRLDGSGPTFQQVPRKSP